MCFSAEASFTSGTILAIIGAVAIRKCKVPNQFLFASIPLMLAVQQFSEGYLWLIFSGRGNPSWEQMSSYVFLLFAQVVWPFWIPLSIFVLEINRRKKNIIGGIVALGLIVSFFFAYRLVTEPVKAEAVGHHISYVIGSPNVLTKIFGVFYFFCTIVPALVSSINRMYLFGISIAVSYLFSTLFFEHYIISVWCFFAAITSIIVFFILLNLKEGRLEKTHSEIEF